MAAGVLAGIISAVLLAAPTNAVQVGQKAPDFTVAGPGNKPVKLDDLLGKGPIVLYTIIQAFTAT
jgi:peroxiredoxin